MSNVMLNKNQQNIYLRFMKHAPVSANANIKSYHFDGAVSDRHWVAVTQMGSQEDNAKAIISLPQISNKIFVSITDADPAAFCELIASFNAESECNDSLGKGYSERVDIPELKSKGWNAILLMDVSELIEGFPRTARINEESFDFHLLVLITEAEFKFYKEFGMEALLKRFKTNKRDLFHFSQKTVANSIRVAEKLKPRKVVPSRPRANKVLPKVELPVEPSQDFINSNYEKLSVGNIKIPDLPVKPELNKQMEIQKQLEAKRQLEARKQMEKNKQMEIKKQLEAKKRQQEVKRHQETKRQVNTTKQPEEENKSSKPPESIKSLEEQFQKAMEKQVDISLKMKEQPVQMKNQPVSPAPESRKPANKIPANPHKFHLEDFSHYQGIQNRWQVVGETALGTLLLVGGLFSTLFFMDAQFPAASVFPGVFAVAGLVTLASAFKDALSLKS